VIVQRSVILALLCSLLAWSGCKSSDALKTKSNLFKSKSTIAQETARRSIEESLAKQVKDPAERQAKRPSETHLDARQTPNATRQASHETDAPQGESPIKQARFQSPELTNHSSYPIDFPTVLRLAGADNWSIKIAQQRVREAAADYCAAKNGWMPSITLAMGYNKHEGEIQSTEGDVLSVSRNSLFLGGGAGVQNSPLNGGSGGPPRMFVDFSLADAIFQPLSARRSLGAEQARKNRVFNDTMLKASLGYYDLVRAQSQLAIAQTNLSEANNLAQITNAFVQSGKGTTADDNRVAVVVNNRRQDLVTAKSELQIASARLATILQLDSSKLNPELGLVALDAEPIPLNLTGVDFDLATTIQQAQNIRCEIAEANSRTLSAQADLQAEQWRPWLPNLYLGYSGGLFGGGQGGDLPNLDGRSDLDVVVSWQVKNLGFGTRARQDSTRSQMYQRKYESQQIKDQIAEQVTSTYQRVHEFRAKVGILNESIEQAGNGLAINLAAIKGLEGLPLEAINSLDQLATSRTDYLDAVTDYNQWQVRLLRAAGQSLSADASLGSNAHCDASGCDVTTPDCPSCLNKPSRCRCNSTASRLLSRSNAPSTSCSDGSCQSPAPSFVDGLTPSAFVVGNHNEPLNPRSGIAEEAAPSNPGPAWHEAGFDSSTLFR
jgi:outer membrane protein TolC